MGPIIEKFYSSFQKLVLEVIIRLVSISKIECCRLQHCSHDCIAINQTLIKIGSMGLSLMKNISKDKYVPFTLKPIQLLR
ncbi:hypothetical protein BpHYR1_036207 [Brachionus plicatilis]|uniref:Uncharacterized protein n=1 Tax=Brachionus plicatilis TaxID=10195 RepID=A0A3M7S7V6_BRAPC|nr:hypothetical protein BpHYR1_036207 [Brachionus plicatilis]